MGDSNIRAITVAQGTVGSIIGVPIIAWDSVGSIIGGDTVGSIFGVSTVPRVRKAWVRYMRGTVVAAYGRRWSSWLLVR